jgi:hypothetical protein
MGEECWKPDLTVGGSIRDRQLIGLDQSLKRRLTMNGARKTI